MITVTGFGHPSGVLVVCCELTRGPDESGHPGYCL